MIEEAQIDGGIAIVVPSRTTGTGPADSFLEGLVYRLATGFAPHPLFSRWVEAQIDVGVGYLVESASYALRSESPEEVQKGSVAVTLR